MSSTGAPTRKPSRLALPIRARRRLRRSGAVAVVAPFILREPQDEREEISRRKTEEMPIRSLLAFSRDRDGEERFKGDDVAVPAEAGDHGIGRVTRDGAAAE